MRHWRTIPAQSVKEVIEASCGSFPPSIERLEALLERHHYKIIRLPETYLHTATTDHATRRVWLPDMADEAFLCKMLLHETAEVLLRLPVASEFHYRPSHRDEFHEVAKIVEAILA
jgi:hypothetical protein